MTKVGFVTNHGVAADPMFEWLPRALASHPDIFVYLGEGVRAKHFKERKRNERPLPERYEEFLKDVAGSYLMALEFYAYRAYQIHDVDFSSFDTIVVNLLRNPHIWLYYYTNWRVKNLNQPWHIKTAIDHEWDHTGHSELRSFGFTYEREEVDRWSFYRGIQILNKMTSDNTLNCKSFKLEEIYTDFDYFMTFLGCLSGGTLSLPFENYKLSKTYVFNRDFDSRIHADPRFLIDGYEPWQRQALAEYWSKESKHFFRSQNYSIGPF